MSDDRAEEDLRVAILMLRICGPSADPERWHRVMKRIDPHYVDGTGRNASPQARKAWEAYVALRQWPRPQDDLDRARLE